MLETWTIVSLMVDHCVCGHWVCFSFLLPHDATWLSNSHDGFWSLNRLECKVGLHHIHTSEVCLSGWDPMSDRVKMWDFFFLPLTKSSYTLNLKYRQVFELLSSVKLSKIFLVLSNFNMLHWNMIENFSWT